MTLASGIALFGALAALAALPSVSVMIVVARAASSGFQAGAAAALGIVAGDILFILLAAFGLALAVQSLGDWGEMLRYAAAAYLAWIAARLWLGRNDTPEARGAPSGGALRAAFVDGLLVTLADHKALIFYFAFLPAFVELDRMQWMDIAAITVIAVVAVGGVKLVYAFGANRAVEMVAGPLASRVQAAAAVMVLGVAVLVALHD